MLEKSLKEDLERQDTEATEDDVREIYELAFSDLRRLSPQRSSSRSGARGLSAEQVVRAAALQFEGARYRVARKVGVRTTEQVEAVVAKVKAVM